jgi:beta-galactosidase/beta-glucuronidase
MILSGRGILKYFTILFLLLKVLYSDNQILFYSQSPESAKENFDFLIGNIPSNHQIIPLIGPYDLIDIRTNSPVGKVSIPSLFHQKYPVIFRKTFAKIDQDKARYLLHFERINGVVVISVNSNMIYMGSNSFLPLTITIPARILNRDKNILEVQIRPWDGKSPHLPLWFPINLPLIGNGICGSVYLEIIPGPSIGEMEIYHHFLKDSSLMTGHIDLHLLQPTTTPYDLRIQLIKEREVLQEEIISISADSVNINPVIPFNVKRPRLEAWRPENTHTYRINAVLEKDEKLIDQKNMKMAVRSLTFKNNVLVIDQEPLLLKGLNYIYQNTSGVDLIDRKQLLRDLQTIKKHGFNAIRIGFYPLAPIFYDLTDSLGIWCLQDLP